MSGEPQGAPRRLTGDEERRGAGLFAAGESERAVAKALGCSHSTAHRLRERLQAAQAGPEGTQGGDPFALTRERVPWPEGVPVIVMRGIPGGDADGQDDEGDEGDEEQLSPADAKASAARADALRDLGDRRTALEEKLDNHQKRALASQQAIARLDAQRMELLAAGQDAAPLRPRRADAEADLADSQTAAQLVGGQITEIDQQAAVVAAEQRQADAEAARQRAARQAARLAPQAAQALYEAVTGDGPVTALADLGARLTRAERAAGTSMEAEVLPPMLPWDVPWQGAIRKLWQAARTGDVAACQAAVPPCVPWQAATAEQVRRETAEMQQRAARHDQMIRDNQARLRQQTRTSAGPLELSNPLPGAVQTVRTGW